MESKFTITTICFEVVIILLMGFYGTLDDTALPKIHRRNTSTDLGNISADTPQDFRNNPTSFLDHYYPMFQDIHVMVFAGFGFLFTFLKKYSYSGVGVNMFLSAILIQWAILCEGFFDLENGKIHISIEKLLTADVAAASCLIAWGAVLGKTSPLQMLIMSMIQMPLFACNEWLTLDKFQAVDPGASMICHAFGAYFGLAVTVMLYRKDHISNPKEEAVYHSDVFAMIGTIFLWLFWPSFNAALTSGDDRHRAVINTYLSLAACCVATFATSSLVNNRGRFNMVQIQNATLAGGVAMGTACATMIQPYAALIIGSIAGVACTLGFKYLTPILSHGLYRPIHDTCGVNNLHGMMGIFGGVIGAMMAALASEDMYGYGLYIMYPALAPTSDTDDYIELKMGLASIKPGIGRSTNMQAGYQMIALVTTMGISIAGGLITGLLLKLPWLDPPSENHIFDDIGYWELPEEEQDLSPKSNHYNPTNIPNNVALFIEEDSPK